MRPSVHVPSATPGLLIDGERHDGHAGDLAVMNPTSGERLTTVSSASASDVASAVQTAHLAGSTWSTMPGAERGQILTRAAEMIENNRTMLAELEALDVGKPAQATALMDVGQAAATFRYFGGLADKINGQTVTTAGFMGRRTLSYTVREPIGVIGAIIPWNAPLMITAWKLGPGLAGGNTFVIKPAEDAPLSVFRLVEILHEAGLPPGVVNVACGTGPEAGAALVEHEKVNKISFTGSPGVGTWIQRAAAVDFKRLTLELGGKSPQIVFPDADIDEAVAGIGAGLFTNSGQVCAAGSRILVHRKVYDAIVDGVAELAGQQKLGNPLDPATTMGPLVNAAQLQRVQSYINSARDEGATPVTGDPAVQGPGYFLNPTLFVDVDNSMKIAQEEVFGPVGVVIPFDGTEEAVQVANDTRYGLTATVWTRDISRAHAVASQVKAGSVWVNGWSPLDPALPWGGVKQSGIGKELGWSGLLADTEEKVVTIVL